MPTTDAGFVDGPGHSASDALAVYGPTLPVRVGFDPEFEPMLDDPPLLPDQLWPALVDTGATLSCIDSALAGRLALPIVDREPVAVANGRDFLNVHLAQMYVPALDMTVQGRFHAVHLSAGGQPHAALIGRSFLRYYTMVYEGKTGTVTISGD